MQQSERGWSLLETLLAVVLVGFGILSWSRMSGASFTQSRTNAQLMKAGQWIENDIEAMRVAIGQDTGWRNWPPKDTAYTVGAMGFRRRIYPAYSPKDGMKLDNVAQVEITVGWGKSPLDTLQIVTYVTKKF